MVNAKLISVTAVCMTVLTAGIVKFNADSDITVDAAALGVHCEGIPHGDENDDDNNECAYNQCMALVKELDEKDWTLDTVHACPDGSGNTFTIGDMLAEADALATAEWSEGMEAVCAGRRLLTEAQTKNYMPFPSVHPEGRKLWGGPVVMSVAYCITREFGCCSINVIGRYVMGNGDGAQCRNRADYNSKSGYLHRYPARSLSDCCYSHDTELYRANDLNRVGQGCSKAIRGGADFALSRCAFGANCGWIWDKYWGHCATAKLLTGALMAIGPNNNAKCKTNPYPTCGNHAGSSGQAC
jgi:hypothetical protein